MKDYTREAVGRQLGAMRCRRCEFTFRREKTGEVEWTRPLTAAEAMAKIPLMKSRNAGGWHIYVQPDPAENRALVLVDDVKAAGLEKLKAHGYPPACVLETSRGNFPTWICFGPKEMPPEERAIVARMLAGNVGADLNSAAKIHLGRLAGFTNVKPKYLGQGGRDRNGRELYPYVLCRESRGVSSTRIEEVRKWAKQKAAEKAARAEQACRDRTVRQDLPDVCRRAVQYAGEWTRHRKKSGSRLDRRRRRESLVRKGWRCRLRRAGRCPGTRRVQEGERHSAGAVRQCRCRHLWETRIATDSSVLFLLFGKNQAKRAGIAPARLARNWVGSTAPKTY